MKKRNAFILTILLVLIISAIVLCVFKKGFGNNESNASYTIKTNTKNSTDEQIEKQKNKPDLKPSEVKENDSADKSEEAEDIQTPAAAENTDSSSEDSIDKSIVAKGIETFEESVNGLTSLIEKDSSSQAAAGSFWDEPLVQSVYSRFSASEIAMASKAMTGNLSGSEMKAVKDMIYGRVSASEIAE